MFEWQNKSFQSSYTNTHRQSALALRFKEMQMNEIIKEVVLYVLFLVCLCIVSYTQRDPNSYSFRLSMENSFVNAVNGGKRSFSSVCIFDIIHWSNFSCSTLSRLVYTYIQTRIYIHFPFTLTSWLLKTGLVNYILYYRHKSFPSLAAHNKS